MAGYIGGKVAVSAPQQIETKHTITATASQTSIPNVGYTVGAVHVYQNGIRLVDGTDYTATNGSTITLETGATEGDQIVIVSHGSFETGDTVSKASGGTFAAAMNYPGGAVTGDVAFGDSNKILMGAGSDLQLYHNGSASYITDQGTGNLVLGAADSIIFQNAAHNENMLVASQNGAVSLYHDNAIKLATTATGIDVTGAITVGGAALGSSLTEYIASVTASSSANISFTGFDDSKYVRYFFVFDRLMPASNGASLFARTSSNGGSSYDSGSTDYHDGFGNNTDRAYIDILTGNGLGGDTNEDGASLIVQVYQPHNTNVATSVYPDGGVWVNTEPFVYYRGDYSSAYGGIRAAAGNVNAIQFYFSTGNIASGNIKMYGIKAS